MTIAKGYHPPAAWLMCFSFPAPLFITHNFIIIHPHLSLGSPTTITASLFSYVALPDWTSFITPSLMYFFLFPPLPFPSAPLFGFVALQILSSCESCVAFVAVFVKSHLLHCDLYFLANGMPSLLFNIIMSQPFFGP